MQNAIAKIRADRTFRQQVNLAPECRLQFTFEGCDCEQAFSPRKLDQEINEVCRPAMNRPGPQADFSRA
jgi:hypothetical protein